jgi:putative hydrolase of the HAD superfamily
LSILGYSIALDDKAVKEGAALFCKEFSRNIQLDPQAKTLLEYLRPKYKIGLISNLSFSESAWQILRKYDLEHLFDFIVVSGDVNMRKPNPKLFKIALNQLGVACSEAIFVGDTLETDIEGAITSGMVPVHINRTKNSVDTLTARPYLTITQLEDLLPILNETENAFLS